MPKVSGKEKVSKKGPQTIYQLKTGRPGRQFVEVKRADHEMGKLQLYVSGLAVRQTCELAQAKNVNLNKVFEKVINSAWKKMRESQSA